MPQVEKGMGQTGDFTLRLRGWTSRAIFVASSSLAFSRS